MGKKTIKQLTRENAKSFRKMAELTQEDMSKLLGISKTSYGQKERGDMNFTTNDIYKMVNKFGVPFECFGRELSSSEVVALFEGNGKESQNVVNEDQGKYGQRVKVDFGNVESIINRLIDENKSFQNRFEIMQQHIDAQQALIKKLNAVIDKQ